MGRTNRTVGAAADENDDDDDVGDDAGAGWDKVEEDMEEVGW